MRILSRLLVAALFFGVLGPASPQWTKVTLPDGSLACQEAKTATIFKPPYPGKADVTKSCNTLTSFLPWLKTADAQAIYKGLLPGNINIPPAAPTLDSPWSTADIGTPGATGSASNVGDVLTMRGAGFLGAATAGRLVYQNKSAGDYEIAYCLTSLTGDSLYINSGLVVFDDRTASPPSYAGVFFNNDPTDGPWFYSYTGGVEAYNVLTTPRPPRCLRLTWIGGVATGYYGDTISTATMVVGTHSVATSGTIDIGVYAGSSSASLATFVSGMPVLSAGAGSAGTVQYSASTQTQSEAVTPLVITLTRAGGTTGVCSGNITNAGTGTAVTGTDFTNVFPAAFSFGDGVGTAQTQNVVIINRAGVQSPGTRTINLAFSGVSGCSAGTPATQTASITDADTDPVLPANSDSYYVAPGASGASDSNNGKYPAFISGANGPWSTMVPAKARTWVAGDDLWVLAGTTLTGSNATFSGSTTFRGTLVGTTCQTRAILGAYYVSGGTAYRGLNGAIRPILQGTAGYYNHQGTWTGAGPAGTRYPGDYAGIVDLVNTNNDCYRVENLWVRNSGGEGINSQNGSGVEIVGNYASNVWRSCFLGFDDTNVTATDNNCWGAEFQFKITGGLWAGMFVCFRCNGGEFSRNNVWDGWGEGIFTATLGGTVSQNMTVQDNFVLDARAAIFYLDTARRMVYRRNIGARTARTNYWRTSPARGPMMVFNDEVNLPGEQNGQYTIYSNIIAGGGDAFNAGLSIWTWGYSTNDGLYLYGNLFVDSLENAGVFQTPWSGRIWSNWFATFTGGAINVSTSAALSSGTVDANYFSSAPPAIWNDAQNVVTGCQLAKTNGWRNLENLGTQESDGHFEPAAMLTIKAAIIAGARPASAAACKNTGTAIASRTFSPEITHATGPANTDFDGNAYVTPDIGPFRQ